MGRARARDVVRERIAHAAARLMAEDGIEDYALAKRKAARLAGLEDSRHLPNNDEIDAALRDYRQIYDPEEHGARLRELRQHASNIMRDLAGFNPYLTGPVLSGTAGKYAGIQLQLFADSPKEVEWSLLNRGWAYRNGDARFYVGGQLKIAPIFVLEYEGIEVKLTVLATDDVRTPFRLTPNGRAIDRAPLDVVEALLSAV